MKSYMLIQGSNQAIEVFEQKIADALEQGYSLAGELAICASGTEVKFFQPVMLEEDLEDDEEYEDEDEDEF